ncbi:MAG TPA: carboxypeptidase regulatory-like domain-containing protein [Pyrinomonadaceae bacterium]|nr:carboxypeptidase regulatory-like domain-containing protein [Pyrinomonadaceae bacterium]
MSKRLVALAACVLWLGAAVSAQTVTGTLQGTVKDPNGAVVPGATVVIHNVETGQERTLVTNGEGFYIATFLPVGRYDVVGSGQGFGSVKREGVEVPLNQTVNADFSLSPTVGETVTVTTNEEPINTSNAEIKGRLTEQEILDKPTFNQSNFLTLAETFTGFQENPTSGQNNPTSSSGSSINFNGTGTRGATFQINGVNNDDASENQNRQGASLSTIKEFQVITNNFTAEFGRGYGAVVLVQTKSGTNELHGDVYLYHNDSALNAANNAFTPGARKPVNRRNQYGFTSGFPLFKNRLFGFVSFDHVQNSGAGGYTRDLFLAAERNPANWFQQTPANNTPANRAFIQSVLDRFPSSLTPNDPRNARTFTGAVGFDRPLKDYSGRLDWNAREADNVFVRWQYTRQVFDNEDIIIGEATKQNNKQQNIGLTWTHMFTNATVGEFRYGLGLRTTLVGIKAGNDTPIIRFGASPVSGSIIGNAGAFPINRWQTDHQFVYNISSLFAGNHFLRAGTDVRRQRLDDVADNFSRGFYSTAATCNGVNYGTSYNAFLNGCVANYQKGYGPFFLENRIREANFYAEDNWKVRPNLTLNLGVRYEYVSAPEEAAGRIDYGFEADDNNIEPRVGFAWSPEFKGGFLGTLFGDAGDSSVRAGYGIYHGRLFQSIFSQSGATVRFNPPNALFYNQSGVATGTFNPNNLADPTNGFVFVPGPQASRHPEAHVDPGLEMPYTQQWSLSFERQLPWRSALRLSYTGNRGIGLIKYSLENLPLTGDVAVVNHPNNAPNVLYSFTGLAANDPRRVDPRGQVLRLAADPMCAGTGLPSIPTTALCPVAVPIGPLEYSVRLPRVNERRPDPRFTTNTFVSNDAWTYYNGLQAQWEKKYSHGLSFQASYTWSKSIDTTSEATNLGVAASSGNDSNILGNSARVSRGLSHFDTRHRLTAFATYRLPFFRDSRGLLDEKGLKLGAFLQDWTVSTVVKLASGTPFSVINSGGFGDLNFDGFTETRPVPLDLSLLGANLDRPAAGTTRLIEPTAFRAPRVSDFGCCMLGRNTFFGDGVQNVDLGIYRTFRMPWESHRLHFRADLFNAFNHVQYSFPVGDLAAATFGRIIQTANTYSPRVVQLSFRYQY